MNETLKTLKLAEQLTYELPIDKETFIERFNKRIEPSDLGLFSSFMEGLSSNKSRYKGNVGRGGFKVRKRKGLSKYQKQKSIAEGHFREKGDTLVVDVQINGIDNFILLNIGLVIAVFTLFFAFAQLKQDSFFTIIIPIQIVFMIGFLYFGTRKSVREIKEDLEDCFSKIVKQPVQAINK